MAWIPPPTDTQGRAGAATRTPDNQHIVDAARGAHNLVDALELPARFLVSAEGGLDTALRASTAISLRRLADMHASGDLSLLSTAHALNRIADVTERTETSLRAPRLKSLWDKLIAVATLRATAGL